MEINEDAEIFALLSWCGDLRVEGSQGDLIDRGKKLASSKDCKAMLGRSREGIYNCSR